MSVVRRNTWQREAVREALIRQTGFVSAQALHDALKRENSKVGLATVYRQLATLVEDDEADVLHSSEGESLYRACDTTGHHHHLICNICGSVTEVEAPEVERWVSRVSAEHGFKASSHVANVFGVCADTAAHRAVESAAEGSTD